MLLTLLLLGCDRTTTGPDLNGPANELAGEWFRIDPPSTHPELECYVWGGRVSGPAYWGGPVCLTVSQ